MRRIRRRRTALRATLGLALAGLLGLSPAGESQAEVRRVEAVGVVPLKQGQRGSVDALDQAIQAALLEAVSRVARDFLMEADPGEEEELDLEQVLGKRMVPYTTRFRILADQGERPAMFAEQPGVTSEYVVEVEVFVDADRVEQRLVEAGLLQVDPGEGLVSHVELELRDLSGYGAYEAVRSLLVERLGARQALPRSFEAGTALLDVQLEGSTADATSLAEKLVELSTPELTLRPIEVDRERVAVSVVWSPPVEADRAPATRDR